MLSKLTMRYRQLSNMKSIKTRLGKTLHILRTKAIAGGMKLLSEKEMLREVKRRRIAP